jgi:hypothetical protein
MIAYIFSALLFLNPVFEDPPDLILPYENNNQLILIFSENNRSTDYERALLELARNPLGLDQIFPNGGIYPDGTSLSEEEAKILRNYYQVEPSAFALIVVNKQLQEIIRSSRPLPVEEIFKRID